MTEAEHTLNLVKSALEDLDYQYMGEDIGANEFVEHILETLAAIVPFNRTLVNHE